ncbi:adenosylcobinamide-GDP ribazoletransferase [Butyrivibrio sp. AE3004]|uniref:adenosylcobinamide-GDP ribazoletransferase n=1 Tax=Butyrivibrio sp. AE3004 TaxID=1506994 RepID=UPI000493E401|nr:adenosylcobinamide-GDP ribazoletransferase [Butyrivibrio sp. AE3004]
MNIFRWLAVTFSMYSKIPMPVFEWKEDDMAHSLTFFPAVGAVIGGLVYILNSVPHVNTLPVAVRIILTLAVPLIITGGFHVDGFMDTEDALHSYASKDKKLEILKDAHIGAFAVISLLKWELLYAAGITGILLSEKCDERLLAILGMSFVLSRALSGLTSILFTKARKSGMLYEETKNKQRGTVFALTLWVLFSCAVMVYMNVLYGLLVILSFAGFSIYYRYKAYKEFGGVTGDTAGFFLTVGEIVSTLVLAITLYVF